MQQINDMQHSDRKYRNTLADLGADVHVPHKASAGPEPDQAAQDPTNQNEAFCARCSTWVPIGHVNEHLELHAAAGDLTTEPQEPCCATEDAEDSSGEGEINLPPAPGPAASSSFFAGLLNHVGAVAWFLTGTLALLMFAHRIFPDAFGLLMAASCLLVGASAYLGSYVAGARARNSIKVLHVGLLGMIREMIATNASVERVVDALEQVPDVITAEGERWRGSVDEAMAGRSIIGDHLRANADIIGVLVRRFALAQPQLDGRGADAKARLENMAQTINELRAELTDQLRGSREGRVSLALLNGIEAQRTDAIGYLVDMKPAAIDGNEAARRG